jgi:hypothetical protein
MKVAIMQPYLFPYHGYFQLIQAVDLFIFLDDVNYIKKGYINRNNILLNGHSHRFTKPVEKVSQNRFINQHDYGRQDKLLSVFTHAYQSAPHYSEVMSLLAPVLTATGNVAEVNANAVKSVFEYLGLAQKFAFSSAVPHDTSLKGQDKIIALCQAVDGLTYVNPPGGRALYDAKHFANAGLSLTFIEPELRPYPQLADVFIPSLSLVDMLMMTPRSAILQQLNEFNLVSE